MSDLGTAGTRSDPVQNGMPTPPQIVRAAYAELEVTNLSRARWFWVDMLGFAVSYEDDSALYLRGYDELIHHNLVLRQSDRACMSRLGYRVRSPEDLDRAEAFFGDRGCRWRRVEPGTTPGIGEALRVEDPLGFTVELVSDIDQLDRLHQRYELRHGAEPSRIDHFNIVVPDVKRAFDHYTALGFGCSETIEDHDTLYAAWMFRKQTVHDVAFTSGKGPRLHHIGFFVHEAASVLRTCDLFGATRHHEHIERGPGRHGVSNALYVYLRDPDGHRIEIYTSDYYTGDPDHPTLRWSVDDPRRRDFWGNPVVPSWYEEAVPVADLEGHLHPLVAPEHRTEVQVGADGYVKSTPLDVPVDEHELARDSGSAGGGECR